MARPQRLRTLLLLVVLVLLAALAEGIRRVPPAEETARLLAEEQEGEGGGSKEWCLEAGFNPEKLKCSTCDKLAGVVLVEDAGKKKGGEALVSDCRKCCLAVGDAAKYARAVLECDEFFLKFLEPFKQLKASKEAAAWEADGKLKYKTKTGVRPTLHLYVAVDDKDKEPAESVSVASWTTESILEFLQDSIPRASAQAKETAQKEAAGSAHEEL